MTDNSFQTTVKSLMDGMDGFLSSKTVVGDPITIGNTIILPLLDLSFGIGAGSFNGEKKKNCGGGMGGKVTTSAVLVIQDGMTKMVSVKDNDNISKLLDMVPDFVNKIMREIKKKKNPEEAAVEEEAREEAAKEMKEILHIDPEDGDQQKEEAEEKKQES